MCFAVLREWRLEHEPTDVVASLEVRLSIHQLSLVEVRSYMRHLDVRSLWIELTWIHLQKQCNNAMQTRMMIEWGLAWWKHIAT